MQEGDIIQSSVAKWDWTEKPCYFLPKQDTALAVIVKESASITQFSSEVLVFT